MAFEIAFIQANQCLTGTGGVCKYTTLETDKVRKIGKGSFSSVLLARHVGEEVVLNISSTYCRRLWIYFASCSSDSIVDLEHVFVSWAWWMQHIIIIKGSQSGNSFVSEIS